MDDSTTRTTLHWHKRPLATLLRLAWPITVSQLSFSLMTAVDTLFVGRLGAAPLAGVALGGMATFTLLCFGMGLLRSTKIVVAQAVGAGRAESVHAYLGASLVVALGLGIATLFVGQGVVLTLPAIAGSEAAGDLAATYASVRLIGAPILLVAVALRETRYGLGEARAPMFATLLANLVNVFLVALFMYGFECGIAGVAWATTLAQLVEALALAGMQRSRGFGLRVWSGADVRRLLRLGVPLGVERFFDVASFSVMIALVARMGVRELAAHQVATQVLLFAIMPGQAIGEATCVLIGQAVGAASLRTVPRVQRAALVASFGYAAACSCTLLLLGPSLAALFTHEAAVIERATALFHLAAVFLLILPFYLVGQSSLRGVGDVRAAAWITVAAAWGGTPLFAAWFGFGLGMGVRGGWVGLGVEFGIAALCFWWRLRGRGGAWLRHARRFRTTLIRAEAAAAKPSAARVLV
jgi:MATE family multidrug resistance protein